MQQKVFATFDIIFNEGIAKICKKFNSHDGFLRADQDKATNCCPMDWIGCAIEEATVTMKFLAYFL